MKDYLLPDPKKGLAGGLCPSLPPSRHAKVLSLSRTRTPHAVTRTLFVFIDGGGGLSFRSNFRLCLQFFLTLPLSRIPPLPQIARVRN
jgi:hypothetical protein